MHPVLRRIDLNLLPVFDAVYRSARYAWRRKSWR